MTADQGVNPHASKGSEHAGPDPLDAPIVVVAVHGRNQSPGYMREHLVERVDRPDVAWILPAAHEQSWYPDGFLAPISRNQPSLDHALDVLARLDDDVGDRDPATVVWCGFSQGACLVAEYLARHPTRDGARRGGLAALTGGMIGPPDGPLTVTGGFDGMPAYFGVGDPDDWVPTWRVHATADAYRAAGATVTVEVFPDRPHEIGDREVAQVAHMIRTIGS